MPLSTCVSREENLSALKSQELSSFVDEIPEELLDVRELEEGSGRSRFHDRDEDGWERPSFGGSRRSNAYGSGRSGGSSSYGSGGYGRSSSYGRSDAGEARAAYGASRKTLSGARVGFKDEPVLKRAAERSAAEAGWHPGELLRHDVFGEGTVLSVTGTGKRNCSWRSRGRSSIDSTDGKKRKRCPGIRAGRTGGETNAR